MNSELLPGGRWLLTCSTRNQYFLHDLHMSSPHPQELVNPGQYDDESGMLDELTSLQIWLIIPRLIFASALLFGTMKDR